MPAYPEVSDGLRVARQPGGWAVTHAASGQPAVTGLRQRRFAEQARTELLATGADFTQDVAAIQRDRQTWADVYYRWRRRSQARDIDPETFEYYPEFCRYGQPVPSATKAAAMRADPGRAGRILYDKTSNQED